MKGVLKVEKVCKAAIYFGGGLIAGVAALLGGWDAALKVLVALTVLDYISGVIKGIITKRLSSCAGLSGGLRKISIYLAVALAVLLDDFLGAPGIAFRLLTIGYYTAVEGISIIENLIEIGVPAPPFLKEVLIQVKERIGDKNENIY